MTTCHPVGTSSLIATVHRWSQPSKCSLNKKRCELREIKTAIPSFTNHLHRIRHCMVGIRVQMGHCRPEEAGQCIHQKTLNKENRRMHQYSRRLCLMSLWVGLSPSIQVHMAVMSSSIAPLQPD